MSKQSPLQKHKELYNADGSLTKKGKKLYRESPDEEQRHTQPQRETCTVTEKFHDLVRSLERAAVAVGEARDPEAITRAYEHLSVVRKALYEYAHELELSKGRDNLTITLRF